jgi:ATP-binding cassette, subfamily A (ABC1), member 3
MSFEKFRILLWKNWIIQKRHWKRGLFELIFPILLVILFTWIKSEYTKDYDESTIASDSMPMIPSSACYVNGKNITKIVFSPTSPWVEEFIDSAYSEQEIELEKFDNSAEMDKYLNSEDVRNKEVSLFGIEFDDSLAVRGSSMEASIVTSSFVFSGINRKTDRTQIQFEIRF